MIKQSDLNPGKADIYSLAKIILLLAVGDPDADVDELGDDFDDDFIEFLENCLQEQPE